MREVIGAFERILGAKLNLKKSMIVPLDDEEQPTWMETVGCRVVQLEEVLTYLGCPVGVKLSASKKEAEFLMDKVCKRIFHWSNRLLSL